MAAKKCPTCNSCLKRRGEQVTKDGETLQPFYCEFCKETHYYSIEQQKILHSGVA